MPPILHNLYDLTGNTLLLVWNRERYDRESAVTVFWLALCYICTVSLGLVKVKFQTRYLSSTSHIPYGEYQLLLL